MAEHDGKLKMFEMCVPPLIITNTPSLPPFAPKHEQYSHVTFTNVVIPEVISDERINPFQAVCDRFWDVLLSIRCGPALSITRVVFGWTISVWAKGWVVRMHWVRVLLKD